MLEKNTEITENTIEEIDGEFYSIVGEGGFSQILRSLSSQDPVVFKRPKHTEDAERNDRTLGFFKNELTLLQGLKEQGSNPYIIELLDGNASDDLSFCRIYFELLGEDLQQYIEKLYDQNKSCSPDVVYRVVFCISSALAFLHRQGIIHRDVKLENVLFIPGRPGEVKLIDFAFAYQLPNSNCELNDQVQLGSITSIAPESYYSCKYSTQSDMYSFYVVIFSLLFSCLPLDSYLNSLRSERQRQGLDLIRQGMREYIHQIGFPGLEEMAHLLSAPQPKDRLSAQFIFEYLDHLLKNNNFSQEPRALSIPTKRHACPWALQPYPTLQHFLEESKKAKEDAQPSESPMPK